MSVTVEELVSKLGLEVDPSGFHLAGELFEGLHHGLAKLGDILIGGVVVGLAAMVGVTAKAADHARKLSQSVGIDSITLQELGYAASLSDVSIDELGIGLQHLAKTGIKNTFEATMALAEQFKGMPDGPAKTKIALEKFGRAGARLIPLLNGGREELAELAQEAHEAGVVFSEADQILGEKFNDSLQRLKSVLLGVVYSIGKKLLPTALKLSDGIRKIILGMERGDPAFRAFTIGLRAIGAAFLAVGIIGTAAAIKSAIAWGISVAPILLSVAALAALLLILEDIYVWFKGGESLIGRFAEKWTQFLDELYKVSDKDLPIVYWLKVVMKALGDIQGTWEGITRSFNAVPEWVKAAGSAIFNTVSPLGAADQIERSVVGASSPSILGGGGGGTSIQAPITVNVSGAGDPEAVAGKVSQHLDAHLNNVHSSTYRQLGK